MAFINGKEVFLVQTGSGGGGEAQAKLDALIDGSITEIESSATSVRNRVFYGCTALTTVNIPNATRIMEYALNGCSALTTANFPNVTRMDTYAFNSCRALKTASFPNVTSIGSFAFSNCYQLTTVIIGTNLTTVATLNDTNAFNYCYHILGTTNSTYNPNGLKDGYIYVPDNLVSRYKSATNWSTYADQIKGISELPTEE